MKLSSVVRCLHRALSKFSNELIFLTGISLASVFIYCSKYLGDISLWVSLAVLVFAAIYYSATFFNSNAPGEKIYFFVVIMLFVIAYFALIYRATGIIDTSSNEIITPDWLNAIYFSAVTWTTLGFGDFRPIDQAKPWVIVEALMGYVFLGLLVGKILFVLQRKSKNDTQHDN